jgi:hypothetical protein
MMRELEDSCDHAMDEYWKTNILTIALPKPTG